MAQLNDLLVTGASRLLNGLGILGSTNADSILPNTTDTYSLGSSSKRWNVLYVKTSNIDTETVGTLTVTNYATIGANQAATGTGTGALRVSGGISATQNSWFGKSIIMTPTNGVGIKIGTATITAASTTNGEIVLQNGHLRFGTNDWDYDKWAGLKYDATYKIIYLGLADKTVFQANSAQSGGTLALPGIRYLSINGKVALDGNDSWLRINENKTFSSGTYFGQSIVRTDNQFQVGDGGNKFYANSSGNGYFSNTLGVGGTNTNYKIYTNGKTKVGDGANATSASTGGLQVAGGIGVGGNSWFGGTVTATKFIGPLQGNADSATNIQGWAPKHFYNEFIGGKWYHINMNNTSSDKTGFYKVADIVLTSGYGTYTAAKIVGYLYDHNGNWEQTETYIMPFQAIINITEDVAYLYSNVLANSEHLRIVKTAVRTYELQARCNAAHTDFDVFYQVIGTAGVTPYETLVAGSTTGTVISITQTQSWGNTAYKASILTNTRTFTVGNTSKNFNGSSNVSWTLGEIGAVNKNGDTMTGMLTINKTQTAAVFGGSVSNISSSVYNPTAGIQICAAAGSATNSTAIGFHNPGISSASIGYYNTDANTGQFKFLSDDATWSVNIGTTVTASLFSGQAEGHRIGYRHLDAGNPNSWNDSRLYIGYGSMYPTRSIGFYNTNSANTGNTLWAEINDNGLYARTRFGVNGQNTSYNFYVNGTSRFNNKVYIGTTARTNELIISGAFTDTTLGTQDGNDRPSLKITGNYPQIVLMAGGANNANHGATLSFASYDTGTATSGAFKSFTMGTQGYNANAFDIGFGTSTNPHTNCMNFSGGNPIMRLESSRRVWHYGISSFCNHSENASYTDAAIQIRETGYGGTLADSWANAPRLAWHWSGRVQTQIALASNGELYVSGNQFANAYKLVYENGGTWAIGISGNAASSSTSNYLNINNSANCSRGLQYMQQSSQTSGNDFPTSTWWHVIKMNHETGDTYYKRLLAFDFWNNNIYTSGAAGDGKTRAWSQVWIQGNSVTGAVWNDYAECRESDIQEPGYVLIEKGDDTLTKSTERMQPFAGVSSDTWGFSQGETERAKTHIAVAGRVLVYPYRPRDEYKPGDCVCAAPNGTVDIMTPNEVALHPDRIVGTVSCVPNYETWGGGELADRDPVQVNGRIWIKVR